MNEMTANDPLTASSPQVSVEDCVAVADRLFGIRAAKARQLTAERDLNLWLATDDGDQYIMKLSNAAESPDITRFQTDALCHVEAHSPDLPVPRVVRTLEGACEARITLQGEEKHTVRVLSYLDGVPLHAARGSGAQRSNLASCLAKLDIALESYHPSTGQDSLAWNITNLLRLEPLLTYQDDSARRLVSAVMDAFQREVVPALSSLRAQVIYNDLNFYNVLVDQADHDQIAGIIDFGDIVRAPLVNDLAVACSYQIGGNGDPLIPAGEFIAAYHEVLPLLPQEADLLATLIAARLSTTVLITGWRAERYPQNRNYILRNNPSAWAALRVLAGKPDQQLKTWVRSCCGMEV